MKRRLIIYGLLVMGCLLVLSLVTVHLVFQPTVTRLQTAVARLAAEHAVSAPDGVQRQARLDAARDELGLELTLTTADGTVLATNVKTPSPPTPQFVVHLADITATAQPLEPPALLSGFALALSLGVVVLVLVSIPIARLTTRPLEALASAARRFGEGDLSQRVAVRGNDEVAATSAAFNLMADRVGASRRAERELLANVSHELRTPMARMHVLLELLDTNPSAAQRYVGELTRDLRELDSLLERIIDATRLDLASEQLGDPYPLDRQPQSMSELVTALATDFRQRAPERPLDVELPEHAPIARIDRTLVRRALMNLLDNAHKYSPPGAQVTLTLERDGSVEVIDSGEGLGPDELTRVFDPFFRADRSRSRATGGVGLGLAFVRRVAVLHGALVSARNEPGRGAAFRFALEATTQSNTSQT